MLQKVCQVTSGSLRYTCVYVHGYRTSSPPLNIRNLCHYHLRHYFYISLRLFFISNGDALAFRGRARISVLTDPFLPGKLKNTSGPFRWGIWRSTFSNFAECRGWKSFITSLHCKITHELSFKPETLYEKSLSMIFFDFIVFFKQFYAASISVAK